MPHTSFTHLPFPPHPRPAVNPPQPLLPYLAPELVGGWGGTSPSDAPHQVTPSADVFALATVAYELLAPPHTSSTLGGGLGVGSDPFLGGGGASVGASVGGARQQLEWSWGAGVGGAGAGGGFAAGAAAGQTGALPCRQLLAVRSALHEYRSRVQDLYKTDLAGCPAQVQGKCWIRQAGGWGTQKLWWWWGWGVEGRRKGGRGNA